MSQMASDTVCQYPHNGHLMRIKDSFYRQKLSIFIQNPEFSLLQNPFFFFSFRQKVLTFLCASSQRKNDFKLKLKTLVLNYNPMQYKSPSMCTQLPNFMPLIQFLTHSDTFSLHRRKKKYLEFYISKLGILHRNAF